MASNTGHGFRTTSIHFQSRARAGAGNGIYLRAVELMARCYRELGDNEKALQYARRAERSISNGTSGAAPIHKIEKRPGRQIPSGCAPVFSVIIPTFNRQGVLADCLDALARQTGGPQILEVIVVDDGSSDGTEPFCRNFRPTYSFQYLRQLNAGAGAARRRGVKHARGEYLLFFNDDTIPASDLLLQHWKAHQDRPNERQACWEIFGFPQRHRIGR